MPTFRIKYGGKTYKIDAADKASAVQVFTRIAPTAPASESPAPDTPRTAPAMPTMPGQGDAPDVLAALMPPPKPKVDSTRPEADVGSMAGWGQQPVGAGAVLQHLFPASKAMPRQAPGKVAGQEAGTAPDMSGAFAPWHEPAPSVFSEAPSMGGLNPEDSFVIEEADGPAAEYRALAQTYRGKAALAEGEQAEAYLRMADRFEKIAKSKRIKTSAAKTPTAGWQDMGGGIQVMQVGD
ncbi:MAG: hypothetical protein F4Y68_13495 [Boseongicola sp. SB0665_bin_10]|nr:hypothetical protein [Boseongicola sp. SB0665_bin_10]